MTAADTDPVGPPSELTLYRTEDLRTRIDVRLSGESVWLTQRQMAELFQVTTSTISEHLQNIFDEGECEAERTVRKFRMVQPEGARTVRREIDHYRLDAVLAVGYRVRSPRGVQFRQWATERLREYLVKGFTMDDERLKRGNDDGYFEELLDASATSAPRRRSSGARCWRSTRPVSTTIRVPRPASASSRQCRTRCTGLRTAIPRPNC